MHFMNHIYCDRSASLSGPPKPTRKKWGFLHKKWVKQAESFKSFHAASSSKFSNQIVIGSPVDDCAWLCAPSGCLGLLGSFLIFCPEVVRRNQFWVPAMLLWKENGSLSVIVPFSKLWSHFMGIHLDIKIDKLCLADMKEKVNKSAITWPNLARF